MAIHTYNRFNNAKILAHSDRLREIADWYTGRSDFVPYPLDWHIYPSNICNHSCDWCMFRQNNEQFIHKDQLPLQVMMRAVEDAFNTGAVLMHFSGGGEPLINKHTLAVMREAKSAGLSVALSTNGSLLTPEVAETVDYIRVSLNAGTREQHDKTNHPHDSGTDWERILVNLKESAPHKLKDLGLAFVVDVDNYMDIQPFCAVAADVGADFVHIRPAFYYDDDQDAMTKKIMQFALRESELAKQKYGDKVQIFAINEKFDGYWSERSYDQCLAVLTGICLTATGDFAVCQDRTDLRFGSDYLRMGDFKTIWNSKEHLDLVRSINGDRLDACPRCVWNNRNQIIQDGFINEEMRLDLI